MQEFYQLKAAQAARLAEEAPDAKQRATYEEESFLWHELARHATRVSEGKDVAQTMTAAECRQQSALYITASTPEGNGGIRATLLALGRAWLTIAHQIDRLTGQRDAERRSPSES